MEGKRPTLGARGGSQMESREEHEDDRHDGRDDKQHGEEGGKSAVKMEIEPEVKREEEVQVKEDEPLRSVKREPDFSETDDEQSGVKQDEEESSEEEETVELEARRRKVTRAFPLAGSAVASEKEKMKAKRQGQVEEEPVTTFKMKGKPSKRKVRGETNAETRRESTRAKETGDDSSSPPRRMRTRNDGPVESERDG